MQSVNRAAQCGSDVEKEVRHRRVRSPAKTPPETRGSKKPGSLLAPTGKPRASPGAPSNVCRLSAASLIDQCIALREGSGNMNNPTRPARDAQASLKPATARRPWRPAVVLVGLLALGSVLGGHLTAGAAAYTPASATSGAVATSPHLPCTGGTIGC